MAAGPAWNPVAMTITSSTVPKSMNMPMPLRSATKRSTGCRHSQSSPSRISAQRLRGASARGSGTAGLMNNSVTTQPPQEPPVPCNHARHARESGHTADEKPEAYEERADATLDDVQDASN